MVELTELPEKWAIKRTKETGKIIGEWANKNLGTNYFTNGEWTNPYIPGDGSMNYSCRNLPDGYTEISFEDFKRLVLKEETKQQEIILW